MVKFSSQVFTNALLPNSAKNQQKMAEAKAAVCVILGSAKAMLRDTELFSRKADGPKRLKLAQGVVVLYG